MRLLRFLAATALLTGLHALLLHLAAGTHLPRLLLLAPVAPGLVVGGWLDLNLHLALNPRLLAFGCFAFWLAAFLLVRRKLEPGALLAEGPALTRRSFLAGGLAAGTAMATYGWSEREHLEVVRRSLALRDLPPELTGLRLALVCDLHRGPAVSERYLAEVITSVNSLAPDLVLLPGDFVSRSDEFFPDVTRLLSQLQPRIGSLATLGNHDHWEGRERAWQALHRAGIRTIDNHRLFLTPSGALQERPTERGLCLAGVGDLWEDEPDLAAALQGTPERMPRLLLSHNPDFAEEGPGQARVDLQLSGHTHGGQIVLPGLGPVASGSRHGVKYLAGLVQGPGWPVYVSRGIGTSVLPVRVGARPEITLFEVKPASASVRPPRAG